MARKHPGMYRVRAARHDKAAAKSSGVKREGHREIASGYRKLARGKGGSGAGYRAFGKTYKPKKRRARRAKKKGKR